MKILVGNNGLANPGGSETYAYAMIHELVKQGHEVEAVAYRGPGIVSKEIEKLGVPIHFINLVKQFDLMLLSHNTSINMTWGCTGQRVQTCHGIFSSFEVPVKGMDIYVAISKEVQAKIPGSYLIYNGVDCTRFTDLKNPSRKLKTVLSLAHDEMANNVIRLACHKLGVNLIVQNKYRNPMWKVEELINKADLVVTLGRGVYEAMACARNVVIFDKRSYVTDACMGDGFVTPQNFAQFLNNNCSGRYSKADYNAEQLALEMNVYSRTNGYALQAMTRSLLNIENTMHQYLSLM